MKKLTTLIATVSIAAILGGCTSEPSIATATKIDLNTVCSVEKSGIESVIKTAATYNPIAQANDLEFRRLDVNNSALITSVQEAIKTGAKEVNPKDFKGKVSKTVLDTNFAAERACRFAIVPLMESVEAKSTWRNAVPGDGLKY
ncbi:hypothetical protein [Arcobacter sp.]|uniref:hypothetical protein n=1 Tax=Arcobacter sp. TaxID=1872629 RepID=UPI003C748CD4